MIDRDHSLNYKLITWSFKIVIFCENTVPLILWFIFSRAIHWVLKDQLLLAYKTRKVFSECLFSPGSFVLCQISTLHIKTNQKTEAFLQKLSLKQMWLHTVVTSHYKMNCNHNSLLKKSGWFFYVFWQRFRGYEENGLL